MILVLDDEPHYIQAYIDTLRDAGFKVVVVTTVAAFMRTLSPETTAVIIDVMLEAGIDAGLAAFRSMRQVSPFLPAIILTNRTDLHLTETDRRSHLVSKRDILPSELLTLLRDALVARE